MTKKWTVGALALSFSNCEFIESVESTSRTRPGTDESLSLTLHFPFSERYVAGEIRRKLTRRDTNVDWTLLSDFNVSETGKSLFESAVKCLTCENISIPIPRARLHM